MSMTPKSLDKSFDPATNSIRTTVTNAEITVAVDSSLDDITIGDASGNQVTTTSAGGKRGLDVVVQDISIDHANDSIKIGDGTDFLAVNSDGTINVEIFGETDGGVRHAVPVTPEGHLEVAIHSPRNPFGSLHVENLYPLFQSDAVYGLNSGITGGTLVTESGSGTVTATDSAFVLSTGTTQYSQAVIQGRKRLRYRPGQGMVCRFTASFSTPAASSYQIAGPGHAEDGVFFGYKDTNFGILYSNRGVREVQTLTITTASSTNENVTVTLNGVAHSIAVTNSANIQRTVYEIASGAYTGWKAEAVGATIVFVADAVGNKAGSFSLTATTAIGTFAETKAGVAATETFITQANWNGDKLNGTGDTGFTLDPSKFNVYQIKLQYLGAGTVSFEVEVPPVDGNNAEWVTCHTLKFPNTLTATSFGNPAFPMTIAAYSAGSTTNLTVKSGSFAGFIEGQKILQGNRFSYTNSITTVGAANFQAIFTVRNTRYYGSRSNQAIINIMSIAAALKHTSPCTIYAFKNATLQGNPNFSQYATNSCSYYDTSATTCTIATNDQLIWSGSLGDTGNIANSFLDDITLQPGESLTIAAKASTGTPSYVVASLNTREDQ